MATPEFVPAPLQSEERAPMQLQSRGASSTPLSPLSPSATVVDLHSLGSRIEAAFTKTDGDEAVAKPDVGGDAASTVTRTPSISKARKSILLAVFCIAQFLDAFNNSALFPALPIIGVRMDMTPSDLQWVFSAYQLTFASFLLLSGRIADISSPKWTFITGVGILGVMSLAAGFVPSKIPLFVLRAFQGTGAALTIPSALSLLVWLFPEDPAQSSAIAIFGGTGCVGNVSGLLIGALFSEFVSYQWCFWFITCAALPAGLVAAFLIPAEASNASSNTVPGDSASQKPGKGSLDYLGVSFLTSAMILFVFGITSGGMAGWGTAQVWVPVVACGCLLVAFFWWEARVPEIDAAMPPSMWFYPNFAVLFGLALLPFGWWTSLFLLFSQLWQDSYGLSTLQTAIHFLPLGLSAGIIITALAFFPAAKRPKRIIMIGFAGMLIASLLLPFGRGMDRYWSVLFPAMILGSSGASLVFVNTNIAIFQTTPEARSGLTGAALNSALQLGCIITVAAVTSITTSVNLQHPGDPYNGVSASFWFVLGCTALEAVVVAFRFRELPEEERERIRQEKREGREGRGKEVVGAEKA